MNELKSVNQPSGKPALGVVIANYARQAGLFTLAQVVSLFIASGRLDWVRAWVYICLYIAGMIVNALVIIPSNPELVVERASCRGKRDLDRVLAATMAMLGPVSICIVAGLDMRFGWSAGMPVALVILALILALFGSLLTTWSMRSNRFFYGVLRIEKDLGHAVATSGPYRYVRHPGYLGMIVFDLAMPLILDSVWAFIPSVVTVLLALLRIDLEDKKLQDDLDHYKDYAKQVRFRLIPGIW